MKPPADRVSELAPSRTVDIDVKVKGLLALGKDVVNLGAGEPIEATPEFIRAAAVAAIDKGLTKYTSPTGIPELKKAICKKFKEQNQLVYEPEQIVISSGAKHCIFNALLALLDPGDEAIIPAPYWVTYPELVKLLNATPVIVHTDKASGFKLKPEDLAGAITPRTKLAILNSPCNPTGAVYTDKELKALAGVMVERDLYCLSDEIYEHILFDGAKHVSVASFNDEMYSRTIVINGISKTFAMTGWRIGYSACSESLAKTIGALQSQSTLHPANPSQYAAAAALNSDYRFVEKMVASLKDKRQTVKAALDKMESVQYVDPSGAFYFFLDISPFLSGRSKSRGIGTSEELCNYLLNEFFLATVPGTAFGLENYLRLSFTVPITTLAEGLHRLHQGLKQLL